MRKTVTPELKNVADSVLLLVDLGFGRARMGGSALAQVYNETGGEAPDINIGRLKAFYNVMQKLVAEDKILAYHDRSDGGLFATLAEMAFAARVGLDVDVSGFMQVNPLTTKWPEEEAMLRCLFNEELGAVLQVRKEDEAEIQALFEQNRVITNVGRFQVAKPNDTGSLKISYTMLTPKMGKDENGEDCLMVEKRTRTVFNEPLLDLQKAWQETSHQIQRLRDNPECADSEFALLADDARSALFADLTFDPQDDIAAPYIHSGAKPKIAVLREQGVNGQVEMAAAFTRAGFDAYDVHMSDLMAGRAKLADFQMLAACGGFSYGDVLGAGEGWAKSILFNPALREQFAAFFARQDTLALGVCNGCQMMSNLAEIIPGSQGWPKFKRNRSEQFEARLSMVEVAKSPSLILAEMQGSRLPVVVSHGEGRADFVHLGRDGNSVSDGLNIALQYIDGTGAVTQTYPLNPNGSPQGIAGVTNADGRITIMMPHPERVYKTAQMSWQPENWGEMGGWYRMFAAARKVLG